jgi:hypothetical protein
MLAENLQIEYDRLVDQQFAKQVQYLQVISWSILWIFFAGCRQV